MATNPAFHSDVIIATQLVSLPTGGFTGQLGYAQDTNLYYTWDHTACSWTPYGVSSNSFTTINCDNGTDPVADSSSDTLNLVSGTGITITGDSSTDTVTIAATGGFTLDTDACSSGNTTDYSHTSSGNWKTLQFDTDVVDTGSYHDAVTTTGSPPVNSIFTIPYGSGLAGWYVCTFWGEWDTNTTGTRGIRIGHSEAATGLVTTHKMMYVSNNQGTPMTMSILIYLAEQDTLGCDVFQNSGGTRTFFRANAGGTTGYPSMFKMKRIR